MIVQFIARNNQYNGWLIKDKLYIVLDIYFNFYNKKNRDCCKKRR